MWHKYIYIYIVCVGLGLKNNPSKHGHTVTLQNNRGAAYQGQNRANELIRE